MAKMHSLRKAPVQPNRPDGDSGVRRRERENGPMMPAMMQRSPVEVAARSFTDAVSDVLGELSQAFAEVLAGLPMPIRRAVDLERALQFDKKLAWQIFRFARATNPAVEGLNVPSAAAVRRLMSAAEGRGVSTEATARLIEVFERYETFVAEHAGDRDSFHSMVGSVIGEVDGPVSDKHRLAMYKAQSHLWGLRADAAVRCTIFHPKLDAPDKLDAAVVVGCRNLHRLRQGAHVAIQAGSYERGAKSVGAGDPPVLLKEFSDPIGGGQWESEEEMGFARLELNDLGRGAAASFYILKLNRPSPDSPQMNLDNTVAISVPTPLQVMDLLVPAGLSNPTTPKVTVYGSRSKFPYADFKPVDVLPYQELVSTVRSVSVPPPLVDLPQYQDVVTHVLRSLGWEKMRFDAYRCRVAYPFFHTHIQLKVDPADVEEESGL